MGGIQKEGGFFYNLLNNPRVYDPFLRYLGDHDIIQQVIRDELDLERKKRILDIGCGTGNVSRMFPKEHYTGIDSDKNYIDFARRKYDKDFICMSAVDLKFENDHFDVIFTKDLFHHLADDLFSKVLAEMKRVLKPTGRVLILEICYQENNVSFYKKILNRFDRGKYIREFNVLREMLLVYFKVDKQYLRKGIWADLAVFSAHK